MPEKHFIPSNLDQRTYEMHDKICFSKNPSLKRDKFNKILMDTLKFLGFKDIIIEYNLLVFKISLGSDIKSIGVYSLLVDNANEIFKKERHEIIHYLKGLKQKFNLFGISIIYSENLK